LVLYRARTYQRFSPWRRPKAQWALPGHLPVERRTRKGKLSAMANVVVVGSQWGDEGKGKIVDWLSERADVVVRYQGGHNAGHALVVDGVRCKLSLLPWGLLRGKSSVIGNGVVIDPHHFVGEIEKLTAQGVSITADVLRIAE